MATNKTLDQLLEEQRKLEALINEMRASEKITVLESIRADIKKYGLTAEEVFNVKAKKISGNAGRVVAPKYRDPETNATWTGRGKPPSWIAGKDREAFLIKD